MRICIVSEAQTEDQAKSLSDCLNTIEAQIIIKERFPTGDAMLPFLLGLSSQGDRSCIIILDSDSSLEWIAKELKIQQSSLKSCLNIYPLFISAQRIPDCWQEQGNLFFVFNPNICKQINRWLASFK